MKYRAPRGTQDILPEEAARWRHVEETFRRICDVYGYGELRTPVFEQTELFVRSVGEHTDIVSKEMYSVVPSGARGEEAEPLTLRPEGTAPALRAYLQNNMGAAAPLTRVYYLCPIFRHERPQKGRLRQHHQAGVEALGSQDPALDAEVIALALDYLHALGISGEETIVNSVGCQTCRPVYRDALRAALKDRIRSMCENCQRRYDLNPLRILDCKLEDWKALEAVVPDIMDTLCQECADHFRGLTAILEATGVSFRRQARLVRGFDYYTKTAFEITHPLLGAQNSLAGGGRYDGLVEELGGEPTPGVGFGSGIERILLAAQELGVSASWPLETRRPVFVISLGETARAPALQLLAQLRRAGIPADTDYLGRSMKAQMRQANRVQARIALILGDEEAALGEVTWKDLESGEQERIRRADALERAVGRKLGN
jgi:histidyl-tRNA synthetase